MLRWSSLNSWPALLTSITISRHAHCCLQHVLTLKAVRCNTCLRSSCEHSQGCMQTPPHCNAVMDLHLSLGGDVANSVAGESQRKGFGGSTDEVRLQAGHRWHRQPSGAVGHAQRGMLDVLYLADFGGFVMPHQCHASDQRVSDTVSRKGCCSSKLPGLVWSLVLKHAWQRLESRMTS